MGDFVAVGDVLATMHANDSEKSEIAKKRFLDAYTIQESKVQKNR